MDENAAETFWLRHILTSALNVSTSNFTTLSRPLLHARQSRVSPFFNKSLTFTFVPLFNSSSNFSIFSFRLTKSYDCSSELSTVVSLLPASFNFKSSNLKFSLFNGWAIVSLISLVAKNTLAFRLFFFRLFKIFIFCFLSIGISEIKNE